MQEVAALTNGAMRLGPGTLYGSIKLLLVAYPRRFRREYGGSMAQVFRDCCRAAERQQGARGVVWLWLATLRDLVRTAFVERVSEVVAMSRANWIRWGGLASVLLGA